MAQDVPGTGSNGSAAASAHGLAAAAAAAGAARGQPVMRGTAVAGNPVIRSDSVVYDDVMVDPGRRLNVNGELETNRQTAMTSQVLTNSDLELIYFHYKFYFVAIGLFASSG